MLAPVEPAFYREAPRLFHIILGQDHGGVESFFVKLTRALQTRGVPQHAAILAGRVWAEEVRAAGVSVDEIKFGKGLRERFAQARLDRAMRRFRPDVVLGWMTKGAKRLPREGPVTVVRMPGFIGLKHMKRAQHAITTTPMVAEFVAGHGFPRDRVHVIGNFGEMPPGSPIDKSTHDTPPDARVIITLGRLIEKKGFDVLIRAMSAVEGAVLWIAGDGELEEPLRELVDRVGVADRVRFLGWVDRQQDLFASADLCVIPSRVEPFGNVVVEAWHSGVPLVATDVDGPGWLIDDGESGLLVPNEDEAALAEAIRRVLGNDELGRLLVTNGRAQRETRFSEEAISRQYVDLFRRLVAERNGRTSARDP